jgi:autophagy-related protein 2
MALENEAWFTQIIDLFDVVDYPVKGYEPPDTVTELNLTLQACGIDYRPLHLPLRAYVTLETFCLSSNISPQSRTSVLRFIIEDGALFLAYLNDPSKAPSSVALASDYACVVDVGLVDLCLRMSPNDDENDPGCKTKVDFTASNNAVHVRTCADSGRALMDLLVYYASDGDVADVASTNAQDDSRQASPAVVDASVESVVPPGRRGAPTVIDMEDPDLNAMVFDAMQDCAEPRDERPKVPEIVPSPSKIASK